MTRTLARLGAAALAVGALTVGAVGNASAAPADTDPPIVTFNPGLQFFAGSVLSDNSNAALIPARATWTQFDADGICSRTADLYDDVDGDRYPRISPSATSFTGSWAVNNYNELNFDDTDCAGNEGYTYGDFETNLFQENSFSLSAGWTTSSCTCWSDGGIVKSSKVGATASYRFYGRSAALVGVNGIGRGSAKVYLDGKLQTTVNENQPDVNKGANRAVVYATKVLPPTYHTIKIVTTTKARVDLDALVVSAY